MPGCWSTTCRPRPSSSATNPRAIVAAGISRSEKNPRATVRDGRRIPDVGPDRARRAGHSRPDVRRRGPAARGLLGLLGRGFQRRAGVRQASVMLLAAIAVAMPRFVGGDHLFRSLVALGDREVG